MNKNVYALALGNIYRMFRSKSHNDSNFCSSRSEKKITLDMHTENGVANVNNGK